MPAQLERRRAAARPELLEHRLVVRRPADRDHRREALRRGAQERGAADVDHLDDVALVQLRAVDRELERIEVHAHEIEEIDVVLGESREILLELTPGENPGVHVRVQRLHAPAEHLGEAGDVLDRRHREPCLLESRRSAAARHELEPEVSEPASELDDAGLVVDGDQRAHSSRTTFGSSRCSATCTRSRSVSTVSPASTGTRSLAITSPVSIPPST